MAARRASSIVCVVALTGSVWAQPAAQRDAGIASDIGSDAGAIESAGSPSSNAAVDRCASDRNQIYVDPSFWAGLGVAGLDRPQIDFELAIGYARNVCRSDGEIDAQFRVGGFYAAEKLQPDGNVHYEETGFFGGELEASWALSDLGLRIGPHLAIAKTGNPSDSFRLVAGGRLRYGALSVGLDLAHVTAPQELEAGVAPSRTSVAIGVGLSVAPPRWLVITAAVVGTLGLLLALGCGDRGCGPQ